MLLVDLLNSVFLDWICSGEASNATIAAPVILAPYTQCNGVENAVCAAGTGCFRSNENYSECRPDCPATWICQTDVAGLYEQCGGAYLQQNPRCRA